MNDIRQHFSGAPSREPDRQIGILMKRVKTGAIALSLGTMIALGVPGAASAGSANLGAGNCNFGSVATQARGNYNVSHNVFAPNLGPASRTFPSDSVTTRLTNFYPAVQLGRRVETTSSGSISNAGALSGARYFCDS